MRKNFFTLLIALFAIASGMKAALPAGVQASTNTGDGAVWYIINWDCGGDGIKPWHVNDDGTIGIDWGGADPANDAQQFCFVGNDNDGYKVYSKLMGDLPLINLDDLSNWPLLGFTADPVESGDGLFDTWFFEVGQGQDVDGGPATAGESVIYNGSAAWWKSGGSQLQLGDGNKNWSGAYAATFVYVSGGTPQNYTITVTNGTSDPTEAEVGATVTITADTAPAGKVFDHWESDDVTFDNTVKFVTTFTMPESNVSITAVFADVCDGDHILASSDTGDGAVWYIMRWDCGSPDGFRPWHFNTGDNTTLGIEWGAADPANDAQLFCFIGNATGGYKIYSKVNGGDQPLTLFFDGHLGFTSDANLLVSPLIDTWFVDVGQGQGVDGGNAAEGMTALYNTDNGTKGWWKNGGSELNGQAMNDAPGHLWAGAYAVVFQYVSGEAQPTYAITVTGGASDVAETTVGATVTVTADTPEGQTFSHWESDDVTFADASSPITTFVMPKNDVSVTAVFATTNVPFTVSTNTGDGAVWYFINWDCGGDGIKPWYVNSDGTIGIDWGGDDPSKDAQQFCFIGNDLDGYKVYSKVALAGQTVNDVTATEDLTLENLSVLDGWPLLGFTTALTESGDGLINTWFFEVGQGQGVDGGPATVGQSVVYNGNYAWWKSGGSQLQLGVGDTNWSGAYAAIFQSVSEYDGINAPVKQADFNVYSDNGKLVIVSENSADASFHVYTILGQSVAEGTLAANRQEVALPSGVYVVKVGDSVKKVIVK